jgi:adenine C2-methylase RlmN of 23S rRNA A2503 and tRNA A37
MIQHNGYSDDALVWVESKLRVYLEKNLTGSEIRELAAKDTDYGTRKWEIKRQKDASALPRVAWSMTIADVARQMHDAQTYCELIIKWGRRTLDEMGPLLQRHGF